MDYKLSFLFKSKDSSQGFAMDVRGVSGVYAVPEPRRMKPDKTAPELPSVYETLQIESSPVTSNNQNNTRSYRVAVIILVITVVVLCLAVAAGVGWYYGTQNNDTDNYEGILLLKLLQD